MRRSLAADPLATARQVFERVSRQPPEGMAFAPGRVNLVGEHTDYNDGFVLPMAIEEGIAAAFTGNGDHTLRVHATDIGDTRELRLDALAAKPAVGGWFRYPAGIAWAMQAAGLSLRGANIAIASNLPSGSGLSSSAALELVVARVLVAVAGIPWDPRAISVMAQRAEHEFAGVACGIMDQMVVACAREGRALMIDCRSLDTRDVALPAAVRVVIVNSGVRRSLASSAYNERRAACERAVAAVRRLDPSVRALRDVDGPLLRRAQPLMDDVAFRRASHVVPENERPARFAAALADGDLVRAGRVMIDSHESLRDLYEVSCPELDTIVSLATAEAGCYGARLTGAGFGGCAVALVDSQRVDAFASAVRANYQETTGLQADVIVSRPSAGARLVS